MKPISIFWFRRDLRTFDQAGLYNALISGREVLPIFIFDAHILEQLPKDDARVNFIHQSLTKIDDEFKKFGSSLAVFYGNPLEVFEKLIVKYDIESVYINHDYEPYARKRDSAVSQLLKSHNIKLYSSKDQVIFEKSEVTKDDGKPYVVYTPYSRKWKEKFNELTLTEIASKEELYKLYKHNEPFLSLSEIGFEQTDIELPAFNVSDNIISKYEQTRNFPALNGTSRLGLHLRFGTVSVREMVKRAASFENETFLKELIWREFFMQILWHFPHTIQQSFKPAYDGIQWENDEDKFKRWCEGKTGYPLVDAGMRELNKTGHMHNRVRMLVASFLCKHLLIDWRWGEAYFASKLLDYEQASNIGNWQWAAGSGVDAAPYFRIFNPMEQQKKFDQQNSYIKKWVPEVYTSAYAKPIVDHKEAREKCLKVYKAAVG